jgi:peptide/nickel transport system ATP-binding protein
MSNRALVEVHDLVILDSRYSPPRPLVTAASLALDEGETVAIVGESGSGKTLTARAIIDLLPDGLQAEGTIRYRGQEVGKLPTKEKRRLRGSEITMLFQDPFTMLSPLRRCWKQVTDGMIAGRRKGRLERRRTARERLAEVGIREPRVADQFPFQLSGGMRQRVALAAALATNPRLLIADEPSTALDAIAQRDILDLIASLQRSRGMGVLLITHDLQLAFARADRIFVMYGGRVIEYGRSADLRSMPAHPYTSALLASEPIAGARMGYLRSIPGNVPPAADVADQCPFRERCDWAAPECAQPVALSPWNGTQGQRATACVRIKDIAYELMGWNEQADGLSSARVTGSRARSVEPVLTVQALEKSFAAPSQGTPVTHALRAVSLEVGRGESVGLVGASGSGKSTLARCVVGLETPDSGRIEVCGLDATRLAEKPPEFRRQVRTKVQMVFQDPYSSLNPARPVKATLTEALCLRATDDPTESIAGLLEQVGLPAAYAERWPGELSGGERQRIAIARALAVRPQLLLCDEPVSALDVSVQAQVLNLLNELRDSIGVSYLFISHDLAVVRQVCERVYVMHRGEIVEHGRIEALFENPAHPYTAKLLRAALANEA